jgi:Protein of unknown function (DUF2637)
MSAEPTVPGAVVFTDVVLRRFLFGVVLVMTAVVLGVAAAAFYTSFEAIRAFAERSGGISPEHAWLAPLLVDSFIFVASAADLWCSATGAVRAAEGWWQRAVVWLPKALLGLAASGSFALNVAHAPTHIGARVVAALAPAALVLTFEILMMIVRRAVAARVTRLSAQLVSDPTREAAAPDTASARAPRAGARSAPLLPPSRPDRSTQVPSAGRRPSERVANRTAEVRRLYLDGITVAEEIARRLSIPPSTTRRLLAKVKQELAAPATSSELPGERLDGWGDERDPATDRSPTPSPDDHAGEQALIPITRGT